MQGKWSSVVRNSSEITVVMAPRVACNHDGWAEAGNEEMAAATTMPCAQEPHF